MNLPRRLIVINSMFKALSGMVVSAQKLQSSANNLVSLGRDKVTVGENVGLRFDLNSTKILKKVDVSKEMVNQVTARAKLKINANIIVAADETIGTILDIKS